MAAVKMDVREVSTAMLLLNWDKERPKRRRNEKLSQRHKRSCE
jgi:hypothetical protein